MQEFNVSELTPHPRNIDFFDDMTGEKWTEFLESVKKRTNEGKNGIIEPVIITQDKLVVSGHQRIRACKELGISKVGCEVHIYDNEDEILQDLIETNIRQRGDVGGSVKKVGLRIKELERLYGVRNGSANLNGSIVTDKMSVTQEDIAKLMDMDVRTLRRYKQLADMIPELSDAVDTGTITKTTALAMMKNLSDKEQEELISQLDVTKKYTQKQVEEYVNQIKEKDNEITTLQSREPETIETIIDNTDYTLLEQKTKELERLQKKYELQEEKIKLLNERAEIFEENSEKYKELTAQIEDLTKEKTSIGEQIKAATSISGMIVDIKQFLATNLSPIKYSRALLEVKDNPVVIKNVSNIVECVQQWCDEMKSYLPNYDKNNVIDMEDEVYGE